MPGPESRTALITGATNGLGRALAGRLAEAGWSVLVHGRDETRGAETVTELAHRGGDVRFLRADLASLDEVRALADRVEAETDRLDVLVSNAGIGHAGNGQDRRVTSVDGLELRFAVNYLAGYLLVRRLLPLLRRSAPARIVNVSSAGQAAIDFDDVMLERSYTGVQAYCQSKLAQVMLTYDLAEELEGTGVTVTALHPATFMPTTMVLEAGISPTSELEDGVVTTLRLVADPELEGVSGVYFDRTRPAEPHSQARDLDARARLRALSDRHCGL